MGVAQVAQVDQLGRDFLTRAARSTDLAEKNELIDRYGSHVDTLQAAGDPKAHQSFRRIMQRARRDYNQEFWWRPGELTPSRSPEVR